MTEQQPVWRQTFDAVERTVGPPLTEVANSEAFAVALGLAAQARKTAQRQTERFTRRLLHQANLPAGSDINRLLTEIGKLQAQVRELTKQVEGRQRRPSA
jgi:hypothetical protein